MPKIKLKPKSPEFDTDDKTSKASTCEIPGCSEPGDHKAPKHRGLNEYYMLCFDHVREYNQAWDFFSGMSADEVEEYMIDSLYGNRPTWKYGVNGENPEDILIRAAWQSYHNTEEEPKRDQQQDPTAFKNNSPEYEALAIMGLEPPITLPEIKTRYKALAKKHHPDLNKGCEKSEALLKQINMAYTILKLAYEQFEKLPERR